ncbi:MAG: hypothetical protein OEV44_05680 [Spirochaetota bacterium]|nr:hypothetical protein [Spirochaetota bacterium]
MIRFIHILILVFFVIPAFSLDFYTINDKDDKNSTNLYSPRIENPDFTEDDISDLTSLITKLKNPSNQITKVIMDSLSPKTKDLMNNFNVTDSSEDLKKAIINDFNVLIKQNKLLYDENLFKGIELKKMTKDFINRKPTDKSLIYLNRLLVQDLFPTEIKSWEFFENDLDPFDQKLYDKATRPYWRRKIGISELPYKYVERKSTDKTINKKGSISLKITDDTSKEVKIDLSGILTPKPTGLFYNYIIKNKLKDIGNIEGYVDGKLIGKRINFTIFSEILNDKGEKLSVNGSFTFGLSKKNEFENGTITLFARIEKENGKKIYLRIAGKVIGSLDKANLKAKMIDVDGKDAGIIEGDIESFYNFLLIN